jgi:hypothetical protein
MGMSLKYLAVWSVITLITIGIATGANGSLVPLGLWLIISGGGYVASLHLHPRRRCWTCEGSGKHTGLVFDYGNRACTTCAGSGRRPRLGARILRIPAE